MALQKLVILMTCRLLPWMRGWLVGAMGLGKDPVLGRPTNLGYSRGQEPIALAVGAGGVGLDIFFLSSISSLFFLPLSGRRPDMD